MEKALRFLKNTITKEDYEAMTKSGLRPGSLTPGQSVFLFLEIKKSLRDAGGGYEEDLEEEELSGIFEESRESFVAAGAEEDCLKNRLLLIREALKSNGLPVREGLIREILRAMKMFDELEELGDGVCEYILRNGVEPTLGNLHSLRFTKESRKAPVAGTSKGPWSFPEAEGVNPQTLISQAGLEVNDFTQSQVEWLLEKGIYASPHNLRILNELWTLNLPVSEEDAVFCCVEAILRGEKAEDLRLFEVETPGKEAGKDLGEATPEGNSELQQLEKLYERIYVKNHGRAAYIEALYREYSECISREDEIEILKTREIPVTADNIYGLAFLCSPEGEGFFGDLAGTVGRRFLLSVYRKKDRGDAEKRLTEKIVKTLLEKEDSETYEAELKQGIHLCRVLIFLEKMRAFGYEEVPVPMGKTWLRLRIRRNGDGDYTARTDSDLTGAILLKYTEDGENTRILTVAEREDTLEELKNSRLIEERLKKAGKEGAFTTYLCKPDLAAGDRTRGFY